MKRRMTPDGPDGWLVVDKPSGITSHDVVASARRALGQSRVGHTGTLDPLATGVLPLLVGRATRLARFLGSDVKTYEAVVRFGYATTTYDSAGTPLEPRREVTLDRDAVVAALARFLGPLEQVPPLVSAKRVGGRRAYELARADVAVELAPVAVEVHELELVACEGSEAHIRVTCSAGFYVRSLAHDLGQALGTGAHLASLRRIRSGEFRIEGALPFASLVAGTETAREALRPLAALLPGVPAVTATLEGQERLRHGRELTPAHVTGPAGHGDVLVRILGGDGGLLAVAERRGASLHPVVVLM
jgi:tRNA pseudouridine55 synthase